LVLAMVGAPAAIAQKNNFDGIWSVVQICEDMPDGVRGYTWRYDVTVQNSHLIGEYKSQAVRGQSNASFRIEGRINKDGTASLHTSGTSGSSDHTSGFAQSGTPMRYRVAARFQGMEGTGERQGARRCHFTFTKR
jgi:hypothetical protein